MQGGMGMIDEVDIGLFVRVRKSFRRCSATPISNSTGLPC
jgi:hypothetical protein